MVTRNAKYRTQNYTLPSTVGRWHVNFTLSLCWGESSVHLWLCVTQRAWYVCHVWERCSFFINGMCLCGQQFSNWAQPPHQYLFLVVHWHFCSPFCTTTTWAAMPMKSLLRISWLLLTLDGDDKKNNRTKMSWKIAVIATSRARHSTLSSCTIIAFSGAFRPVSFSS